jgi:lysophospholipase L1-like esterase
MAKEVNNQLSSQESENFTFINFHDLLSVDGTMNAKLTTDGTHLNEEGYKIWKKALQPYLDNLK